MYNTPRIALTGKMRSGKTSAADFLFMNYGFRQVSFGDALKRVANDLFEDSPLYVSEDITESCPFSDSGARVIGSKKPRKLYQDVGTVLRQLDPDVWIRQVATTIEVYEDSRSTNGIVIDDLRQPNEYEWARDNGFTIIRITSDEDARIDRIKARGDDYVASALSHETETHSDGFDVDYEICNNGTYDEFVAELDRVTRQIVSER